MKLSDLDEVYELKLKLTKVCKAIDRLDKINTLGIGVTVKLIIIAYGRAEGGVIEQVTFSNEELFSSIYRLLDDLSRDYAKKLDDLGVKIEQGEAE